MFDWVKELPVAITVMDENGKIIYMNDKSCNTFQKYGGADLIGKDLFSYHGEAAQQKIKDIIASGTFNCYTIEKNGVKKMIYQTPWYNDGKYAGLLELSLEISTDMPHYIRS